MKIGSPRSKMSLCAWGAWCAFVASPAVLRGDVVLTWSADRPLACAGDVINVRLFALTDDNAAAQFSGASIFFEWDPATLTFLGLDNSGAVSAERSEITFPDLCGANELNPPADGDGYYLLRANAGQPVEVSPTSILLTTFRFRAVVPTTETVVRVLPGFGNCLMSAIQDADVPGLNLLNPSSGYGSTSIEIDAGPVFTRRPQNRSAECDGLGNVAAINAWLADVAAEARCGEPVITHNFTSLSRTCGAAGFTVVTWTARDAVGHTATTVATFTVLDTTPPVLTVPVGRSVHADAGTCQVLFPSLERVLATDTCSQGVTMVMSRSDGRPNLLDPYAAANSPVTITWTAVDDCGNRSTATQVVTVSDQNVLNLDVEHQPRLDDTLPEPGTLLRRCIRLALWNCPLDRLPTAEVDTPIEFPVDAGSPHLAQDVPVLIPCGEYHCVTARDPLHTLRSTAEDLKITESAYETSFVGPWNESGHWLVSGNFNDDGFIDVLDFAIHAVRFQTSYGAGDAPCGTPFFHLDLTGDGRNYLGDFSFIHINMLRANQPNCCGRSGAAPSRDPGDAPAGEPDESRQPSAARGIRTSYGDESAPVTSISVPDLWRLGMGELAAADINGDGWLDLADVEAFQRQPETPGIMVGEAKHPNISVPQQRSAR